ncbi:hypothetical protein BCU68_05360 [Vibrio sp. 10N.286.49.B3]|uniref:DUF3301 domain-containing protein n=1 Tax=Vibrio sp. 10N.286.49.B3 TaxID=1880855 RepID=UPI000C81A8EB|nr:DUF3301 domain-containing protein [Vibrio sp. 10N.286.49.B3]PMH41110.1 hypothetical protein BCU68_05360 [Vibrio sp. 10N.286.49.B3]
MISDLLAILLLSLVCFAFWQQRRQSELAKMAITRKCEQLELQLVSIAFSGHKFKTKSGKWRWHTQYHFEFSALGDDCYQGEMTMLGFRPAHFNLPPHRML